jgi:hypothetical protein
MLSQAVATTCPAVGAASVLLAANAGAACAPAALDAAAIAADDALLPVCFAAVATTAAAPCAAQAAVAALTAHPAALAAAVFLPPATSSCEPGAFGGFLPTPPELNFPCYQTLVQSMFAAAAAAAVGAPPACASNAFTCNCIAVRLPRCCVAVRVSHA